MDEGRETWQENQIPMSPNESKSWRKHNSLWNLEDASHPHNLLLRHIKTWMIWMGCVRQFTWINYLITFYYCVYILYIQEEELESLRPRDDQQQVGIIACAHSLHQWHTRAHWAAEQMRATLRIFYFFFVVKERFIHAAHSWTTTTSSSNINESKRFQRNVSTCRALCDIM